MTARSVQSQHAFTDCLALYEESVQSGLSTRLCPPSVRRSASVDDTISLAIQHPQHDDATELVYATITQRTNDDDITATVIDPRRIIQPTQYSDDETQQLLCTVHEGESITCQSRHIGWVVDKAAVRDRLGWGERRRNALDEMRESERREQEFDAAREQCTLEKGSVVSVDAALMKQEKKQRQEEQRRGRSEADKKKPALTSADVLDYDL